MIHIFLCLPLQNSKKCNDQFRNCRQWVWLTTQPPVVVIMYGLTICVHCSMTSEYEWLNDDNSPSSIIKSQKNQYFLHISILFYFLYKNFLIIYNIHGIHLTLFSKKYLCNTKIRKNNNFSDLLMGCSHHSVTLYT